MTEPMTLLLGAILVNNFVLVQFLGLCPFMGVSNRLETALSMSLATTFVLTLASAASHLVHHRLLVPLGLEPLAYRIVVLKRGYLTAPFQAISERAILVLSPGPTNCDVTQLDYVRANRPLYPLDEDATWSAN